MTGNILKSLPNCLNRESFTKRVAAGHILQFQDEAVENVYFIKTGRALGIAYDRSGKENWICTYEPGQLIGIDKLMTSDRTAYQIEAKTDLTILIFKKSLFLDLMNRDPVLMRFVLENMAEQLRNFQLAKLETRNLTKRGIVASEFKRLARPVSHTPEIHEIFPAPNLSEMALLLGVARETVSRTVSEFVKNDVLERSRGAFIIPDLSRLEAQMR